MRWSSTRIAGVLEFTPEPHVDDRGFFSRTFDADVAREAGIDPDAFLQDSMSRSRRGVVRGLHIRVGEGESKLVRCSSGRVFDVVVDLRPDSLTFCRWVSAELSADNRRMLYAPAGFAHGYQTLTDDTELQYLATAPFAPSSARGVRFDDPALGVSWPLPVSAMSDADRNWPALDRKALDFSAPRQQKSGN